MSAFGSHGTGGPCPALLLKFQKNTFSPFCTSIGSRSFHSSNHLPASRLSFSGLGSPYACTLPFCTEQNTRSSESSRNPAWTNAIAIVDLPEREGPMKIRPFLSMAAHEACNSTTPTDPATIESSIGKIVVLQYLVSFAIAAENRPRTLRFARSAIKELLASKPAKTMSSSPRKYGLGQGGPGESPPSTQKRREMSGLAPDESSGKKLSLAASRSNGEFVDRAQTAPAAR